MEIILSAFKGVAGALKILYIAKRYKKQIIDEAEMPEQFSKAYDRCIAHIVKLSLEPPMQNVDKSLVLDQVRRELSRDNEFFIFYRGEIEERIFKTVLPEYGDRFNVFIKYSYYFLNGFELYANRYYLWERFLAIFYWKKTVLHYISIPGWPNLTHEDFLSKIESIKKPEPRLYEKYVIEEATLIDKERPAIGEAIDKVISSGTVSTETTLNLMASEQILWVHKYAEDFDDVYNGQKDRKKELENTIKDLKTQINDEQITEVEKKKLEKKLTNNVNSLELLDKNWATVPIGTSLEAYGFERLFYHMDGVYGIPLSLIPAKERDDLEKFFSRRIEKPARAYVNGLKKENEFVRARKGDLKYITIFHKTSIDQLSIFEKGRSISASPLLSKALFKVYLSKQDSEVANLYLHELIRNVDVKFFLDENNKTDSFIIKNLLKLKNILYEDYKIDLARPSLLLSLSESNLKDITKKLVGKSKKLSQPWRITTKLREIIEKYKALEAEFKEIEK